MRPFAVLFGFACLWVAGCRKPPATPAAVDRAPAFWVWHRSSPLDEAERASLPEGSPIFRQIAEFGWRDEKWSPRIVATADVLAEAEVPVVRIDPGPVFLERSDGAPMLAKWLRHHFGDLPPAVLQLDYDCPVRMLPRYATFLGELRRELSLRKLTITALAGWIDSPAFPKLAAAVDELLPMFYDLTADPPEDIAAGKARPMAGAEAVRWIDRWKSCRTPWRAGLANFERLTLFEADGTLVGHLRQWSPESVAGAGFLEALPDFSGGAAYRVTRAETLEGTRVQASQILVWRAPGDDALRDLISRSFSAGATGIVWFALPGPGLRAARSPSHLAALARGESPVPALRTALGDDGRVVLRNDGPGDLFLSPGGPLHRLELDAAEAGTFADAGPGGFANLASPLPPHFSRKIVLSFPRLFVGEDIKSEAGLIRAREGRGLQWSLDGSPPSPIP